MKTAGNCQRGFETGKVASQMNCCRETTRILSTPREPDNEILNQATDNDTSNSHDGQDAKTGWTG
jgi:hypothetical protein